MSLGGIRLELLTRDSRSLRTHARTLLMMARRLPGPMAQSLRADAKLAVKLARQKDARAADAERRHPDDV